MSKSLNTALSWGAGIALSAGLVSEWANARNLIKGATAKDQTLKLVSEFGEIAAAILVDDEEEVRDGIGDVLVVLLVISEQLGRRGDFLAAILEHGFEPAQSDSTGAFRPLAFALRGQKAIGLFADSVLKGNIDAAIEQVTWLAPLLARAASDIGESLDSCLQAAYDSIKNRKGVMYNGAFIKSTDERYGPALKALGLPPDA